MSVIDILCVFDVNRFEDNDNTFKKPDGRNFHDERGYESNKYIRMITHEQTGVTENGTWKLKITAQEGDVIRWMDTPINQGHDNTDMVIYDFKVSNTTEWDKYLTPLEAREFNSLQCAMDGSWKSGQEPSYQYLTSRSNYLTATVKKAPDADVTLTYLLRMVKLREQNGQPVPVGYYAVDPTIIIKP